MRRSVYPVLLALVALIAALFVGAVPAAASGSGESEFEIEAEFEIGLSGDEEVPSVATDATGEAKVEFEMEDGDVSLEFELKVCDIVGVTQAHIHAPAGPGTNAPPRLFLFPFDSTGSFSAEGCERLSRGEFSRADLDSGFPTGLFGISFEDFVAALLTGNAYINVHTLANPPGEIRGQLAA